MLELYDIQDTIRTVSDAIASVMNMEVLISDIDFRRVGDSNKQWGPEDMALTKHSILANIMTSGEPLVLDSREKYNGCKTCEYNSNCTIKAMIGIPIKYNNIVLGGIEIVADTEDNKKVLLEKTEYILNFINKMAELIVSKLLEKDTAQRLNIMQEQLVFIMDSIDDGIAALDKRGYIAYHNSQLEKMIGLLPNDPEKLNIVELLPEAFIEDLVENGVQFRNRELNIHRNRIDMMTLVSGKPIRLTDRSIGAILTFKKMSDVFSVVNDVSLSNIRTSFDDIIGESPQIISTKNKAKKIAGSQSTILIQGESGTGKELLARAIHECSARKNKPFIPINCAAIPDTLLESELFGYEEGAFTGAKRGGKMGKFQLAEGGTIFLDEVGEIPIYLQAKLLRFLQEKAIEKVGSSKSLPIDVRIISATNRVLEEMVENGEFREDLYYRLNVIPIFIPPLRERQGDVKILLKYFLKVYNSNLNKNIKGFSSDVESTLLNYNWNGNIRELQNVVEYAVNMENYQYISMDSIPSRIKKMNKEFSNDTNITTFDNVEKGLIERSLKLYGYNVDGKKATAKALGISLATLYRKIKLYNIC